MISRDSAAGARPHGCGVTGETIGERLARDRRRAVDHEGEVLEVFVTKRRDRRAALKFLKHAMKRYGRPGSIVTDRLRSYRAAMNAIGNAAAQTCGRWLNNLSEMSTLSSPASEPSSATPIRTVPAFEEANAAISLLSS